MRTPPVLTAKSLARKASRAILGLLLSAGLHPVPPPASAQTLNGWFDLGERRRTFVHCAADSTCWEAYEADAFGVFPPGSWVWQEIRETPCDQLRWPDQLCWNGAHVRAFRVEFSDGGCGCGGYVEKPSTLRLTWDPAAVAARGLPEADLRLAYNDPETRGWRPVEGALPDTDANAFLVPWQGEILGVREYAIVTPAFVPVLPVTWGRIKSLLVDDADAR